MRDEPQQESSTPSESPTEEKFCASELPSQGQTSPDTTQITGETQQTTQERWPVFVGDGKDFARNLLERLRALDVPLTLEVRLLVQNTSESQMERNVSALEEEAASKGLRSPIAAFRHFVKNDLRPRNDPKSWWKRAVAALGSLRFDQLIQAMTEYAGAVRIFFTNGQQLTLAQAQGMTWEAIATFGEQT